MKNLDRNLSVSGRDVLKSRVGPEVEKANVSNCQNHVVAGSVHIFMTFAWYAHLKNLNHQKWYIAAVLSWRIALFEHLLQVPANRSVTRSLALLS
jgi:uncharacterized protein (DUF486 family)